MQKGIIGKKIGMTQIFDENAKVVPVTIIEAGPCVVVQKKTVENDGYAAEPLHKCRARKYELRAQGGELILPRLQKRAVRLIRAQQRVALPERNIILLQAVIIGGLQLRKLHIQKSAPLDGALLDEP